VSDASREEEAPTPARLANEAEPVHRLTCPLTPIAATLAVERELEDAQGIELDQRLAKRHVAAVPPHDE